MVKHDHMRILFYKIHAVALSEQFRALLGMCLWAYYTGGTISEELRTELKGRLERVYKSGDWGESMVLCPGCHDNQFTDWDDDPRNQKKCAAKKDAAKCTDCLEYVNCKPQAGLKGKIEAKSILAGDVTWAILPYVYKQYGN